MNLYVIHGIRKNVMEEAGEESGTIMDLWLGVLPFILGQAMVIAVSRSRLVAAEPGQRVAVARRAMAG
jgi:hypothetical protein